MSSLFTLGLCSGSGSAVMSKKRSKRTESASLRALIDEQLAAAAREILVLLTEPHAAARLKQLVTERLAAAAEQIVTAYEASRAGTAPEEPGESAGPVPTPASGSEAFCRVTWCLCAVVSRHSDVIIKVSQL